MVVLTFDVGASPKPAAAERIYVQVKCVLHQPLSDLLVDDWLTWDTVGGHFVERTLDRDFDMKPAPASRKQFNAVRVDVVIDQLLHKLLGVVDGVGDILSIEIKVKRTSIPGLALYLLRDWPVSILEVVVDIQDRDKARIVLLDRRLALRGDH